MDTIQLLLYLGTRMQELKEEEEDFRSQDKYTPADICRARYDELKMLFNELKNSRVE